jgi:PAS domain S-box-containing protein
VTHNNVNLVKLAGLLLLVCLVFQTSVSAQLKQTRRVLIFNELGSWSPRVANINQEIFSVLENLPYHIEFYSEDLDANLFQGEAAQRQFRDWYFRKYQHRKPDLIIAVGPSPIKLMAASHDMLAPHTPIVFWGSAQEFAEPPKLDSDFTGVWGTAQPEKTLDAALHLQPRTKHVMVAGAVAPYDRHLETLAKEQLRNYESKLEFTYLTDLAVPDLLERLKHLPRNTIVFHTSILQDAAGSHFDDETQSIPMVASAANAPVFAVDEEDVGRGTVGGDVFSSSLAGRVAAGMAARVLNGERPQDIPIVRGADIYLFDWRALRRWGLEESDLPPGSVVLDREQTFWEAYQRYIIAGILVLLAQALVIAALLWQRAKRKQTEAQLIRYSDQLRLAMESGKAVGWEWDLTCGRDSWFGDLRTMFGIPSDMFVGNVGDFFRFVHPEDQKGVSEAMAHARQNHELYTAEFRVVRVDGALRWVASRGAFEYGKNGEATRMLGMAIDITERKKAEEALKSSEEKFSKAFRESPLAVTLTSIQDHRYIEVNETFERLTGWRRDEALGRTPFDIEIWVDPGQREELIRRLVAEGTVRNLEVKLRRKDGEIRSALGSSELIEIQGEPCALSMIADVTDLKQAEEAKQVSERRFKQFFETLPEYCFMASVDGEILDVNLAACVALGYSKGELVGKPLSFIYVPEALPRLIDLSEQWKKTGSLHNEEIEVITKSGQKRVVLVNAGSVKDAHGNLLHSATVLVDITDDKQTQNKLRESQDRLEGIIASAMDAIIAVDYEQRIVVFNAAAEKMFGCQIQEAIGSPISRFIAERFRTARTEHVRHFEATGATTRAIGTLGELSGLRANGEEFPIEVSISQQQTGGDELFTVIIRDITERTRAENVRRTLAAIVQSSDDAILSITLDGVIASWNPGAQRLYGYTEAEALGQPTALLIPAELREEENEIFRQLTAGKSIEHFETIRVRKGGQKIDVSLTLSPIRDSTGKIVGASKIARDITEEKKAEAALLLRLEFEKLLSDLSTTFINVPEKDVSDNVERSLDRIGQFLGMDRIRLFELTPDSRQMKAIFTWQRTGAVSVPPPLSMSTSDLTWWTNKLLSGEVALASDLNALPEEALAEKEYFRQHGIVSAAAVPLRAGGDVNGAISFLTTHDPVSWTEDLIKQLRIIGEIFWNALKRKRAMEELLANQVILRESEERFRRVANTAPVMIWMAGADKLCTYLNLPWLQFTGRSLEEELESGWTREVHPDDLPGYWETYARAFDRREPFQMEYRLRRYDGEYCWMFDQGVPRFNSDGSFAGYIGSCIDITDRKLAQEALSDMSRKLIEAQEEERTWIARELHDDITQQVALLSVNLERLKRDFPTSAPAAVVQGLEEAIEHALGLGSDIQALSHRLHSSKLEYLGIATAASSFCRELSEKRGVQIEFHSECETKELRQEAALCLFRVLQESLQNALKHSGSQRFEVWLKRTSTGIELSVRDWGVGFKPEAAMRGQGLGLTSMRERLKLVRGELAIDSQAGLGTTVRATVTLRPDSKAARA